MPVTNRKNPIFKIASAAVVLGSSLLVSLPLGAQFLYPSPIFDASYNDFWSSRGCDPDIMKTIACTLQMAIDDGLDYRNFAQVVQASGLMEDLSKDSGEIKFTVLIPKNSTLSAATWENLLKSENKDELKHCQISYHSRSNYRGKCSGGRSSDLGGEFDSHSESFGNWSDASRREWCIRYS
jgi:Fasciclin domain